jgi:hypothetical protein
MGEISVRKMRDKKASIKRALARNGNSSAEEADDSETVTETIPVTHFQSHTKEIVTSRFADIIAALAQKSAEGSLSHTKYLFEISGLREELRRQTQEDGEPTLAALLLAEVQRHQEERASRAAGMTAEANETSETGPGDGTTEWDRNRGAEA